MCLAYHVMKFVCFLTGSKDHRICIMHVSEWWMHVIGTFYNFPSFIFCLELE